MTMPKKGGRWRVPEKDVQTIKTLIDNGLTPKQISEIMGWSPATIRSIKRGTLDEERKNRLDKYHQSTNQGPENVTPEIEASNQRRSFASIYGTPSLICLFLKDVAAALVKLADGLDAVGGGKLQWAH